MKDRLGNACTFSDAKSAPRLAIPQHRLYSRTHVRAVTP